MRTTEEYEAHYGEKPDGLITKAVTISGENEDEVIMQIPVMMTAMREGPDGGRHLEVHSIAGLYKGLLGDGFDPEKDLVEIACYMRVKKDALIGEWQATVENSPGGFYRMTGGIVDPTDPTTIAPKIRITPISPLEEDDEA